MLCFHVLCISESFQILSKIFCIIVCHFTETFGHIFEMMLFLSFLQIEEEEDCTFDYLEIFDGGSTNSPTVGKFCGDNKPKELISTSSSLYFKFRSDGSVSKKGFQLSYEAFSGNIHDASFYIEYDTRIVI